MKKNKSFYLLIIGILVGIFAFSGCTNHNNSDAKNIQQDTKDPTPEKFSVVESQEPTLTEVDWSNYFEGLTGTAIVYDPTEKNYMIYNKELALTQRSPCSTFKIISSLIGLENGIIDPDNSVRPWSGEIFWNEDWNRDINFSDAFRTSCVWYFRQVTDDIGKVKMQNELNKLKYGNCDISDWEGKLNTNNNNRALTGFWIESSLKISPKEQVEVMERIFGTDSTYSERTQNILKQVMLISEENNTEISIYGKTGMGKAEGIVVDAWFTGFAETLEGNKYFCVYLGQSEMQATHQALPQRKSPFKFLMTINDNKIPYQKSPQTLTGWAIFL